MMPTRRLLLATPAILAAGSARAQAAPWPSRPIRVIAPAAPGGPIDVILRPTCEVLREILGQPFVIENVGGAGGSLGVARLSHAAPDGYTIGLGNTAAFAINPYLTVNVGYDSRTDFVPVSMLTEYENILLVNAASPVRTMAELVALGKSRPQGLVYGSSGIGSSNHLSAEMLRSATGVTMEHIPYRGAAPAMLDLLAGRLDFFFDLASTTLPQVRAGQIRAVATTGRARHPLLPEVPTIGETYAGFETVGWMAIFGPKGLPEAIRDKLNGAIVQALARPDLASRLTEAGYAQRSSTPAELVARIERDSAIWSRVIREANIKAE